MRIEVVCESEIVRTARVKQVEGMFDIAAAKRSGHHAVHDIELPAEWHIGAIVGPSGAGKSTLARRWFGDQMMAAGWDWPEKQAVVDGFPESMSIAEVTTLLASVGFGSPPSWLRPFHALSNGEQFRANLARTIAERAELAVVDEYTSVVDRTVAQIGSAAVQKTVRKRGGRFVAVTCHYDVLDWLEPDWVYEPHLGKLHRGRLRRRPKIQLTISRVHSSAWALFRQHHYLSGDCHRTARCFCAFWRGVPVGFDAWLPFVGRLKGIQNAWRVHRTVVIPDFQGVGIGAAMNDYCASVFAGIGKRVFFMTSHPALIGVRRRSEFWEETRRGFVSGVGDKGSAGAGPAASRATNRSTSSFEYRGPRLPRAQALRILGI